MTTRPFSKVDAQLRGHWESLRETWYDVPAPQTTTRRPCDRCGKPLPIGEPAHAVRLPAGGYSIQHPSCARSRRLGRSRVRNARP